MKFPRYIAVVLVAGVVVAASCAVFFKTRTQTHLAWNPARATLAPAAPASVLHADFVGTNLGREPVTISKVVPDCDCLIPEQPRTEPIPPGGSATVRVAFHTGIRSGHQKKTAKVFYAGKELPDTLTLSVVLPEVLKLAPEALSWAKNSSPQTLEIAVECPSSPLRVLKATSSSETFSCSLETVRDGKKYLVRVTPQSTAERKASRLVIETDYPSAPWRRVEVPLSIK